MDYNKILMGGIGILTTLIGGWDLTLQVLLILMATDVVTGVIKGFYKGAFTSKEFRQGLMSKAGFLIVIILCYQVDTLLGNAEPIIRTTCAIFYITIEGSSIIENLGEMGVPIPKALTKRLAKLKDMSDEENEESDQKGKIER
ncbi:phage holin family protein [Clostridium perfringens]|nr:phage holin family protein [Clostridium perfringens]MDK0834970.1 phage holin family protein [Clostridium perfringens]MDM0495366.1 phage holin family protein [Clostridium perfringens]